MTTIEQKAVSLDEQASLVRRAFEEMQRAAMPITSEPCCLPYWVVEVYTDYIIICENIGDYYRIPYTLTNDGVQFAVKDTWESVEKDWIAAKGLEAEPMTYVGDAVKSLTDSGKVGGYLVRFSSANDPDLTGDFFTPDTDFDLEWDENGYAKSTTYFNHGLNPIIGKRTFKAATLKKDEFGIFAEGVLNESDEYENFIYGLSQKGRIRWSSGVPGHLVEREKVGKANRIKRWPLGKDASYTHTPAEPRNMVLPIKSLPISDLEPASNPAAQAEGGQPSASAGGESVTSGAVAVNFTVNGEPAAVLDALNQKHININGVKDMADELQGQTPVSTPAPDNGAAAEIKRLDDRITQLLNVVEKIPAVANSGYVTQDGGTADRNIKSFGDFLLAIKRGDTKRLTEHYNVKALGDNSLTEDQGSSGGFLVPAEYNNTLLAVANSTSGIIPLVKQQQVRSPRGFWPSLDQFFAPTAGAGNSAFAGGINATLTAEGGTFTETEPSFEMVEWSINKIGGVIYVTTELMNDSPISIEGLLTQYIGVAVANKEEYYTLRGNGVGQPLGILNSDAAILTGPDTNDVFAYSDAAEILSRFKSVGGQPTWIAHPSTIPDLMKFEVGTGGAVWVANVQGQVPMSLLGYPVRFSEHLPQANNAGHVGLYDLSAYILFRLSNISIAYSEHAAFTSGKVAWRFEERLDGKPALKDDITLADPQGSYTVSPFSLFQD